MWDEIFKFESFINCMNFFKNISRPPFEIFTEIVYFNNNSPITRKKCQSSLTTAKGQWLEEQHNDTYTFIFIFNFIFYSV